MRKLLTLVFVAALVLSAGAAPRQLPTTLLHEADFTFAGAFAATSGLATNTHNGLVYHAANDSIIMARGAGGTEMAIPVLVTPASGPKYDGGHNIQSGVPGLNAATTIQTNNDLFGGQHSAILGDSNGRFTGSLLIHGSDLYGSVWAYYDASAEQTGSHFKTIGLDWSDPDTVVGPVQISTTNYSGFSPAISTGWLSRHMASIPTQWQAALGGNAIVGHCCTPIVGNHSHGPNGHVIDVTDIGVTTPVPAQILFGYPRNHRTLGTDDQQSDGTTTSELWNLSANYISAHIIKDTATLVVIGRIGLGDYCYGDPTNNQSLHETPTGKGDLWCYDPFGGDKGNHAYPYTTYALLYDVNDFLDVIAATKQPYEVVPYEWFEIDPTGMPDISSSFGIEAVAYDDVGQRLILKHAQGGNSNGLSPTFWVYDLDVEADTPAPPTTYRLRFRIAAWVRDFLGGWL